MVRYSRFRQTHDRRPSRLYPPYLYSGDFSLADIGRALPQARPPARTFPSPGFAGSPGDAHTGRLFCTIVGQQNAAPVDRSLTSPRLRRRLVTQEPSVRPDLRMRPVRSPRDPTPFKRLSQSWEELLDLCQVQGSFPRFTLI
jgi:hypothetical protein